MSAHKPWLAVALPLWVLIGFVLAQIVAGIIVGILTSLGVEFSAFNTALVNTIAGAFVYVVSLVIVIGLPRLVLRQKTSRKELGLSTWPSWLDGLLPWVGFIVYMILSGLLVLLATYVLPFVDFEQVQETGYSQLTQQSEVLLAFLMLVVIAPVAEEILFRGYLFGKLRAHVPVWAAILLTSLLFAAVHGAWNVAIDVFALSIVLCVLRLISKSLWPSIMLHMIKNAVAFYLLFINPTLLGTLGG